MGICASCLGLDRHTSQDIDETDALLGEENAGYGATGGDGQVDEEELRREREELDRITNAATENMVDVHHPDAAELGPGRGSQRSARPHDNSQDEQAEEWEDAGDGEEDEEEAAWLQSLPADNLTAVQGMQAGGLVLDAGQLREEPSAAKRSLKAKMGG